MIPEIVLMRVIPCPRKTAATMIVNRGLVNRSVVASPTGMNMTQEKHPKMTRLPSKPTNRVMILWLTLLATIV